MAALLILGSGGPTVRDLTDILVERGYLTSASTIFERRVKAAVGEFQARHVDSRGHPLEVDGKVGGLTWWALRNTANTDVLATPVVVPFSACRKEAVKQAVLP